MEWASLVVFLAKPNGGVRPIVLLYWILRIYGRMRFDVVRDSIHKPQHASIYFDAIVDGRTVRSTGDFATSPVTVGIWPGSSNEGLRKPSGAVRLSNVTVIDSVARPFLQSRFCISVDLV